MRIDFSFVYGVLEFDFDASARGAVFKSPPLLVVIFS